MATLLTGPRKSGRSLLGRIFVRKTSGRLFDDAEDHDEEALFHAWNHAQETRRPLLIVADAPAPMWNVALPDLRSRLTATPHIEIAEPDDELIAGLIMKLLGEVPDDYLLNYLTSATQATPTLKDIASYLEGRIPGPDVTPDQLRNRSWWTGAEVFVVVDDCSTDGTAIMPSNGACAERVSTRLSRPGRARPRDCAVLRPMSIGLPIVSALKRRRSAGR